ncbi:hypothetical protein [Photobacterium kishitanii]|uniref:hypothetical protein n=1 Tax=Photobacterium kishitanii TaxID=318456 RepID=UPI000432821F|nr:hypothetical protein [Photobacterium kishitanii]CEO39122.1 hypothetical protein PPBDW_I21138 [Photobacterium kishitanii]
MINNSESGIKIVTYGALGTFFETVLDQYKTYCDFASKNFSIAELEEEEIIRLGKRQNDTIEISNIFTGMFLEAFIFDYAARKESINYAETYLDKLDPVSKWVVITRLFNNQGLDVGGKAVQGIKKAFRIRNSLAHNKSKKFPDTTDADKLMEFFKKQTPERLTPPECVAIIKLVLEELIAVDNTEVYAPQLLDKMEKILKSYPMTAKT